MFVVTAADKSSSEDALNLVHSIEKELFDSLGRFKRILTGLIYPQLILSVPGCFSSYRQVQLSFDTRMIYT